jgi:hypothetical protein
MRFSSPITLSWKGVCFKNSKYSLFLPWTNPFKYQVTHLAQEDEETRPSKLYSLDYQSLITDWVSKAYKFQHIIVLTNVNVEAKNIQFWAKVPTTSMSHFLKDVVILRCSDKSEVIRLVGNIPPEFADAQGYSAGSLLITNKDI